MGMFQTLGSDQRFGVMNGANIKAVTPLGSSQATAAQLQVGMNAVAGANGTLSVRLPKARPGAQVHIYSSTATNGLPVYPQTGGNINGGTNDAAVPKRDGPT
jgi:hypothetical protein